MSLADELGILRHPHPQLGTLELQRLGHVIANQLPRTMLGTLLVGRWDFRDDFIALQVSRQFLAAACGLLRPATNDAFLRLRRGR